MSRLNLTNKELKKTFLWMNEKFFENRLDKRAKVRFETDLEDEEDGPLDGLCEAGEIFIASELRGIPVYANIVLLHEMIHLDNVHGHGIPFKARLNELVQRGAYDELL